MLRSLSVAAAVALNDQSVESEDDMTEGNSKSEVEGEKTGKPQEKSVHHATGNLSKIPQPCASHSQYYKYFTVL